MELLRTKNVGINFGGLKALEDINMEIFDNELIGLIGPNGAGKTTVFNLLTGVYKATSGKVEIMGTEISKLKSYQIVALGLSRTFQNIRLFNKLSVLDNVKIANDRYLSYNTFDSIFRTKKYREQELKENEEALKLLKIFDLDHLANFNADSLSYGQQRKLEMARALATKPKLLLLDEPAAGMNPQETQELMKIIDKIRKTFKISILLIEHDMGLVMGICERLYVLNLGRLIASGTPYEIQNNKEVIKAYLGD